GYSCRCHRWANRVNRHRVRYMRAPRAELCSHRAEGCINSRGSNRRGMKFKWQVRPGKLINNRYVEATAPPIRRMRYHPKRRENCCRKSTSSWSGGLRSWPKSQHYYSRAFRDRLPPPVWGAASNEGIPSMGVSVEWQAGVPARRSNEGRSHGDVDHVGLDLTSAQAARQLEAGGGESSGCRIRIIAFDLPLMLWKSNSSSSPTRSRTTRACPTRLPDVLDPAY